AETHQRQHAAIAVVSESAQLRPFGIPTEKHGRGRQGMNIARIAWTGRHRVSSWRMKRRYLIFGAFLLMVNDSRSFFRVMPRPSLKRKRRRVFAYASGSDTVRL